MCRQCLCSECASWSYRRRYACNLRLYTALEAVFYAGPVSLFSLSTTFSHSWSTPCLACGSLDSKPLCVCLCFHDELCQCRRRTHRDVHYSPRPCERLWPKRCQRGTYAHVHISAWLYRSGCLSVGLQSVPPATLQSVLRGLATCNFCNRARVFLKTLSDFRPCPLTHPRHINHRLLAMDKCLARWP